MFNEFKGYILVLCCLEDKILSKISLLGIKNIFSEFINHDEYLTYYHDIVSRSLHRSISERKKEKKTIKRIQENRC